MRAPFFITGLPRSRTAWLANLFTWGDSFCYHDIIPECGSLDELDDKWISLIQPDQMTAGFSDSSILLIWRALMRRYPDAKWVIVKRDCDKACESFVKYFEQHPYKGMPALTIGSVMDVFQVYDRQLLELKSALRPNMVDVVLFEDLIYYDVCRVLLRDVAHEYLSEHRWKLLNSLRINTFSEGRAFERSNTVKFKRLLNECVLAGNGIETLGGTAAECGVGCALPERHATKLVHNESR